MRTREVHRIVHANRQTEGGGFVVRRPFPIAGMDLVDPFLLLDEMGPWTTHRARPSARPTTRIAASRP